MTSTDVTRPFTSRELRDQVGLFPTGVAVITAMTADGERLGTTVSSFASVSLDPPLLSFNLANSSQAFRQWASIPAFAVNILGESQSDLSTRFARSLTDKWDGVPSRPAQAIDAPLLPDALAWFECTTYATHEAGDHLIILGEVQCLHRAKGGGTRPLVFFGSKYRRLDVATEIQTPYDETLWLHGW
jgi:flavin reductase (DIM6/NTAB) family NADH-FMN oxidoreductase RutF